MLWRTASDGWLGLAGASEKHSSTDLKRSRAKPSSSLVNRRIVSSFTITLTLSVLVYKVSQSPGQPPVHLLVLLPTLCIRYRSRCLPAGLQEVFDFRIAFFLTILLAIFVVLAFSRCGRGCCRRVATLS